MLTRPLQIKPAITCAALLCFMLSMLACGGGDEGATPPGPSGPPANPLITLTATPKSSGTILLSWNAVGDYRHYWVFMNGYLGTQVVQFDQESPVTAESPPLQGGVTYCFRVVAYTFTPYWYVGESSEVCVVALSDIVAPTIPLVDPGDGSFAPTNTTIRAWFSEPVNPQTVTTASFLVSGASGSIAGNVETSGYAVTFTPSAYLPYSSTITVTITTAVTDFAGNALASNYSWTFSTNAAPDTNPPTVPTGLSATRVTASEVDLSWASAVDDVGVAGYKIYRDSIYIQTVTHLALLSTWDRGLSFNTQYCYTISAYDLSGNESAQSGPVCVTTLDFLPGGIATWGGRWYDSQGQWVRTIPDVIADISSVSVISPQGNLAVKSDGTVWQLGFESIQVQNLSNATAAAGGFGFSLAIRSDGTVWAWGRNTSGQLGDGTTTSTTTPVQMLNLSQVVAVATGAGHSLALKSDGTVWATGGNWFGQLGDGTTTSQTAPIRVLTPSNIIAIAASYNYSLALKSDGTVWAWGGGGPSSYLSTPTQVPGISDGIAIAQGLGFSLAVKADGTVWAWGGNGEGELGDGTITSRTTPGQVTGLSNVIAVASGYYHSLALKADGTVWAWGGNMDGQLGDGTTINKSVPVQVLRVHHATAIAAGQSTSAALRN
jgi:hypothetical protein